MGSGDTGTLMSRATARESRSKFRLFGICGVIEPTGETLDRHQSSKLFLAEANLLRSAQRRAFLFLYCALSQRGSKARRQKSDEKRPIFYILTLCLAL